MLFNTLVPFSLPRRLVLRGSQLMRVQATDILCGLHLDRCSQTKDFAVSNFTECLRTPTTGLWVLPISRTRIPGWLQAFFALLAVLASEVGYSGKTGNQKRLAPDSLTNPVPTTLPMGFSWAVFFCQDVTDHYTPVGADSPYFVCRDHSTPPLLRSTHGMGSPGFRWSFR